MYTESLNQVRNSEEVRTGPSDDPAKALQRLKNLISSSSEIAAVSADFCRDSESSIWTFGDIAGFIPCEPEFYKQNSTLDMALRQSITDRAIWLRDTELSVRDQLAQLGAIINASENVRLQKTVAKLTRWIVVLTVLAVILAAAQLLSNRMERYPAGLHLYISKSTMALDTLSPTRPWHDRRRERSQHNPTRRTRSKSFSTRMSSQAWEQVQQVEMELCLREMR